ncbi:Phage major capsid protein E [Amphritea atlantica]|uniref:Phage major capsid protein E n=1 Tax=Amphritea atlantica TaxID=355243 RepID=A0A1H9GFX1_9GAMM|nr:major capsid protein [Amphritea atlantica]SEQ49020.1 Phage major capsid protein E [Amphritea atlantica]
MDTFGTADLLGVVEKKSKFQALFLALFFPQVFLSESEEIKLDALDENIDIAVTVSPVVGGKVIADQGYKTRTFKAAYVKPKHEVDPQKLMKRRAGERLNGALSMDQRREAQIADNMIKEDLAIQQYEEKQAVDAIISGGYTVEGEGYPAQQVDFGQAAANNVTLGVGEVWTGKAVDSYDPTDDMTTWAGESDGLINVAVMDSKTWALFHGFKAVKEKLDTRRGSTSMLETALKNLGETVSFKGWFGDVQIVVTQHYYTEGGVKKRYLPDYCLVMGNTENQGVRAYGAIKDAHAVREGMTMTDRYPRNWITDGDPAREYTMIQSSPLMVPMNINDFVVVTVG